MRVFSIRQTRKYIYLKDLCRSIGYNKIDLIEKLESKRKEKSSKYYQTKQKLLNVVDKEMKKNQDIQWLTKELQ